MGETEKCLSDVLFVDSTDVTLQMEGGRADDAGFVQVMRGRILDNDAYPQMMAKMTQFQSSNE